MVGRITLCFVAMLGWIPCLVAGAILKGIQEDAAAAAANATFVKTMGYNVTAVQAGVGGGGAVQHQALSIVGYVWVALLGVSGLAFGAAYLCMYVCCTIATLNALQCSALLGLTRILEVG